METMTKITFFPILIRICFLNQAKTVYCAYHVFMMMVVRNHIVHKKGKKTRQEKPGY